MTYPYTQPEHIYMDAAERELGKPKWDTARGTIAGVIAAFVLAALAVGINNIDGLAGIPFTIYLAAFATGGYLFGKKVDENHHLKIIKRAEELQRAHS